jgi:hypothetical protein
MQVGSCGCSTAHGSNAPQRMALCCAGASARAAAVTAAGTAVTPATAAALVVVVAVVSMYDVMRDIVDVDVDASIVVVVVISDCMSTKSLHDTVTRTHTHTLTPVTHPLVDTGRLFASLTTPSTSNCCVQ